MRTHVTFRAERFDPRPPADAPLDLGWHDAAVFDRGVAAPAATPFTPPSWERA